jgi:hypothetical protein
MTLLVTPKLLRAAANLAAVPAFSPLGVVWPEPASESDIEF